jgi:hypothetical protein
MSNDGNEGDGFFIYNGQRRREIPEDVTYIKVHPSIRVIRGKVFFHRSMLMTVILGEGLEEIGKGAFEGCALSKIIITLSVKAIKDRILSLLYADDCDSWGGAGGDRKGSISTMCLAT